MFVPDLLFIIEGLTGERGCGTTMTITKTTDRRLSYTSGKALCSRHNGTILSEASFQDGCANGLTDAVRVAWRGLPDKNITALTTFGIRVDLSRHFLVVCEFRKSTFSLFRRETSFPYTSQLKKELIMWF